MYDYNRDLVYIIVIHTCLLLKNVSEVNRYCLYYGHTYLFTPEKCEVSLL